MFIHTLGFALFQALARWRQPQLTARLLLLTTRPVPVGRDPKSKQRRLRVLVFKRLGFQQDVEQSFRDTDDFEVISWPSFAIKAFAAALLAPSLDHNNYVSTDPKVEATKVEYRNFLAAVWRRYTDLIPVDVVLTANFAYFNEREFGAALEELGTPFIALHKENVRPPRRINEYWFNLYKWRRGRFGGRKILVYNDLERKLEIETGIAESDRIVVTGMPRLDRLHRWRREHVGERNEARRPHVLFFAFLPRDKLTAISRKPAAGVPGNFEAMEGWNELNWGRFWLGTHRAIVDMARLFPDLDVTIKCKGQDRNHAEILRVLDDGHPLPKNLSVVTSGDPYDLIVRSQVVVGFNTTALLEALATGKAVIVPRFAEAAEEKMRDLVIDLGGAVEYAGSPEELKMMTANFARHPREIPCDLLAETRSVLKYWAGNDDGRAGQRVADEVRREVESHVAGRRPTRQFRREARVV